MTETETVNVKIQGQFSCLVRTISIIKFQVALSWQDLTNVPFLRLTQGSWFYFAFPSKHGFPSKHSS